jgi:succinoglycan biosynthesis transport protein ExoP
VLLFELLNKTIRRPSDVARVLKAAPLATIPFIQLPRRRRFGAMRAGVRLATVGSLAAFAAMYASIAG